MGGSEPVRVVLESDGTQVGDDDDEDEDGDDDGDSDDEWINQCF